MQRRLGGTARDVLRIIFVVVLVSIVGSGCTSIVLHPDDRHYASPEDFNLSYREVTFPSNDGTVLSGWWLEPKQRRLGTVMVAHGNAQNISSHFAGFVWLVRAGYEVFIFDYRGFGTSQGEPSLEGALEDTQAALTYVLNARSGPMTVIGQSLGGALMIDALARSETGRIKLAVFDSAFASLPDAGQDVLSRSLLTWPFQWSAQLVLSARFDPIDRIGDLTMPKLFVAGSADTIVSPNHSWQLFSAAARPRAFWLVEDAGHIGAFERGQVQQRLLQLIHTPAFDAEVSAMLIFDTMQPKSE